VPEARSLFLSKQANIFLLERLEPRPIEAQLQGRAVHAFQLPFLLIESVSNLRHTC
jgi:hypothetical protein